MVRHGLLAYHGLLAFLSLSSVSGGVSRVGSRPSTAWEVPCTSLMLLKRQSLAGAEPETRTDSEARTRTRRFQVQVDGLSQCRFKRRILNIKRFLSKWEHRAGQEEAHEGWARGGSRGTRGVHEAPIRRVTRSLLVACAPDNSKRASRDLCPYKVHEPLRGRALA
jgi:hypothetical protein